MFAINILVVLAALSGLLAAGFWLRVAASRALRAAARLDGTERLAASANRRALQSAIGLTAIAALLAVSAYFVGHGGLV